MARSDRLFRLLQALRTLPPPVTANRLAEETEVSLRTLYRDIASLRAAGAHIDGAPGYGYALTEDPALPPQSFERIEIEALSLGLGEVMQRGGDELRQAAQNALSKITATLPERQQQQVLHSVMQVYGFEKRTDSPVQLSRFWQACWDERALDISFVDIKGQRTERRILPLALAFLDRSVVVLAWCCLRQDYRRFTTERILQAKPTDESFRPRRAMMLRDYVELLTSGEAFQANII